MAVQEEEVEAVIDEKNLKLENLMKSFKALDQEVFNDFVTSAAFVSDAENHLLKTLLFLVHLDADYHYSRKEIN
jgi:hypothetical protein